MKVLGITLKGKAYFKLVYKGRCVTICIYKLKNSASVIISVKVFPFFQKQNKKE